MQTNSCECTRNFIRVSHGRTRMGTVQDRTCRFGPQASCTHIQEKAGIAEIRAPYNKSRQISAAATTIVKPSALLEWLQQCLKAPYLNDKIVSHASESEQRPWEEPISASKRYGETKSWNGNIKHRAHDRNMGSGGSGSQTQITDSRMACYVP